MPYKTGIRLLGVARNPANGFPARLLGYAGYDMLEAANGEEGFEKASSQQPDIILLDVMMPVMDGFETLKRLKENPATKTIPVIMLTAMSAARGEQAGLEMGVSHYLTKPFNPGTVEIAVRVALREAGATAS